MVSVEKVLQRAEKQRQLGRFDKTSAIEYFNDALYEIAKRQSITNEEEFNEYPFNLEGRLIKLVHVDIEGIDKRIHRISVSQGNKISVLKSNHKGNFVEIEPTQDIKAEVKYVGFIPVKEITGEVDFPEEFETSIMFYVRGKMFEEIGEMDFANHYMNQYSRDLIMRAAPKVDVVSIPSEYSLL